MPKFERFNYRARRVVYASWMEAHERRATSLEPEHLTLGLLHDDAVMAKFFPLAASDTVRTAIEARHVGPGKGSGSGDLPLSRALRRVFKQTIRCATEMRHSYAGPEHVLMALLLEDKIPAAALLRETGISAEAVRTAIAGEGEAFASLGESLPLPTPRTPPPPAS